MQAKLVKIELKLRESTLSFWQTRDILLVSHTRCSYSVDLRRLATKCQPFSYHRRVLIGSLAMSVYEI